MQFLKKGWATFLSLLLDKVGVCHRLLVRHANICTTLQSHQFGFLNIDNTLKVIYAQILSLLNLYGQFFLIVAGDLLVFSRDYMSDGGSVNLFYRACSFTSRSDFKYIAV